MKRLYSLYAVMKYSKKLRCYFAIFPIFLHRYFHLISQLPANIGNRDTLFTVKGGVNNEEAIPRVPSRNEHLFR